MRPSPSAAPTDARSGESTCDDQEQLPPLRIKHLLLMTTVMAVLLAISNLANIKAETTNVLLGGLWGFSHAVAFSVVLLGCVWRRSGMRFPSHPGHGLAILGTLNVLLAAIGYADMAAATSATSAAIEWYAPSTAALLAELAVLAIAIIASFVFLKRLASNRFWRWFFLIGAVGALSYGGLLVCHWVLRLSWSYPFYSLSYFSNYLSLTCALLNAAFLTVAVWIDWRRGFTRHWTHWFTIVSGLPFEIAYTCSYIHALFFFSAE